LAKQCPAGIRYPLLESRSLTDRKAGEKPRDLGRGCQPGLLRDLLPEVADFAIDRSRELDAAPVATEEFSELAAKLLDCLAQGSSSLGIG
jgi:hypothetical protein